MVKRTALACMLCLLLLLPVFALAADPDPSFDSPTRDPGAPSYDPSAPEALVDEQLVARSFILMERSTGEILMSRDPDVRMFPASTTKIMTALIALQQGDLERTLEATPTAMDIPSDSSVVPFKLGEQVPMIDVLYGMLLKSGNEAANMVAEAVSGDIGSFVARMNEVAALLGCTNTHFVNAHGYHDDLHQTTARDLATMFDVALDNPTFREIVGTATYDLSQTQENPPRKISNSNIHLFAQINGEDNYYYYDKSIGGKTGSTSQAGYVLVEAAEYNGVELICVVMYDNKYARWMDTKWLFDYGFTQYTSITPEEIYEYTNADGEAVNQITVQIAGFDTEDQVMTDEGMKLGLGRLPLELKATENTRDYHFTGKKDEIQDLINNYSYYSIVSYNTELRAPIAAGQVMGTLTFYPRNEDPVEYQLVATRSIKERDNIPPTLEEIEQRVLDDPSPFPPFDWDWVLPPIIIGIVAALVLRVIIRAIIRKAKRQKQIPTPKKRTFT